MEVIDSTPETKPLSTVLKVPTLGELVDNKDATLIAKIDELNAEAKGNYTLSAITETTALATGKGVYTGTVDITFTLPAPAKTTVVFDKPTVSIKMGTTDIITTTVENGVGTTVIKSSDESVATITTTKTRGTENNKVTITPVKEGTVKITATNNEVVGESTITITAAA